jgi:hypothetical protein
VQKIVSAVTLIKWTLWNWPHTRTDCSQVVKIATLSEGFRQDVREVTRTDCSLVGKMALLSEEFRQDVREVTRTDCSLMAKMALLSEEFRQDVREVTSSDKFSNNRVQDNDHSYMLFIFVRTRGKLASYAAIDA